MIVSQYESYTAMVQCLKTKPQTSNLYVHENVFFGKPQLIKSTKEGLQCCNLLSFVYFHMKIGQTLCIGRQMWMTAVVQMRDVQSLDLDFVSTLTIHLLCPASNYWYTVAKLFGCQLHVPNILCKQLLKFELNQWQLFIKARLSLCKCARLFT